MRLLLASCALLAACSFDKPPPIGGDDTGDDDPIDAPGGGGGDGANPDAPAATCTPVAGRPPLALEQVVTGLDMPVYVTSPPGETRLFVLEKQGAIRVIVDDLLLPDPFATINVANVTSLSDERGLLGLAFHPDFASNRKLYVYFTRDDGNQQVTQYLASATNPNVIDEASATPVITIPDTLSNHNGGMIAFGPDRYLYIGVGDGGGGGDPGENAEDINDISGKMLRIDVSTLPYTIPADNPFAGATNGADEVWSYGLRNPWRWSFDRMTGDQYIGDVGQGAWEEIDVEPAAAAGGTNWGWDQLEGNHCYEPSSGCSMAGRTPPVYEYSHTGGGCTVVGGYVYRGCRMPDYHGTYFFGEYCSSWVRSFTWDGAGGFTNEQSWPSLGGGDIVSFGEDGQGELYIVRQDSGQVMRIIPE